DNGMGAVTEISYRSSTTEAIDAKARKQPWKTTLPHPVAVISEVRVTDSLRGLGGAEWESRTRYDYSEGYYDGKEREFRGFGWVTETTLGNEYQPGSVSESRFHVGRNLETGADEEVLKGKPYTRIVRDATGLAISTSETRWELRWLCQEDLGSGATVVLPTCNSVADKNAHKDALVALAVSVDTLNGAWEKTAAPRYSATHNVYDAWGHPTRSESYGEVTFSGGHVVGQAWELSSANVTVGNDEQVLETDYIYDLQKWMVGLTKATRMLTWSGQQLSASRLYYDGAAYVGLAHGQVDQGKLTRKESWLDSENRWVPVERTEYNGDGLPIGRMDPMGDVLVSEYDAETRLNPVVERVQVESETIEFGASWDPGLGVMTSLRNPNAQTTQYRYDGLGRLSKVIDPMGSEAEPLIEYGYSYGNPISTTTTRQLVEHGTRQYRTSYTYTDGLGRTRLTKQEAESRLGYVASGWTRLSPGASTTHACQAFATNVLGYELPPDATPCTRNYYDEQGRSVVVVLPAVVGQPQARTSTQYLPYETRAYSERDNAEGTLNFPAITRIDGQGRVREIEKTNQVGQTKQTMLWQASYYASGELASLSDPKGNARSYGYDSLGRLTSLADPNLGAVTYAYNDAGQMTTRRDGLGQEKRMVYGVAGRLMRVEYARSVGGTAEEVHVCHYDVAAPNSPINNPSNLAGKLAWVEGPVNAERFSYDALDRMTAHAVVLWDGKSSLTNQTRNSYVEQMTHNAASDVTAKHLPGGFDLSFDYNARGLVERVRGGFEGENRTILASGAFDAHGRTLELTHGNATKACQKYDERGRLLGSLVGEAAQTQCTQVGETGIGLQHLTFQWGYDGTLAGLTDLSAPTPNARRLGGSFQYDRIAQLIAANTEQGVYEYSYDTIQNLVTRKTTLTGGALRSEVLEYGSAGGDGGSTGPNRVTKIGDKSYPYDAIGNLQQYNGFDLSYDVDGRLIKAEKPGQKTLRYYYDTFGDRRVLTVDQPGKATAVYQFPFAEYELRKGEEHFRVDHAVTGVEVTRGPGIEIDAYLLDELTSYAANPVGKAKPLPEEYLDLDRDGDAFDSEDLAVAIDGYWNGQVVGGQRSVWRYSHRDQLGSTTSTSDSTGDLVSAARYHPYGEVAERQGTKSTRGFAGSEVDPEDDLGLI
ncbi:MAG: toxin TcdB middle/N-terminal domain-containing protein, partial [Myxococcales bacterium]